MALSFADAPQNLFNILGAIGSLIKQVKTYQTAQYTNMVDTTAGVVAQLNAESDVQALMGNSYISLLNSTSNIGQFCQQIAAAALNRKVYRDNPRIAQNLQSVNLIDSLREVIRQMKAAGASVLAQTITATPALFSANAANAGNGVIVASTKRPLDGMVLENALAETILFTCISDSYTGGNTEGNESFQVNGVGNQGDLFAFDWPLGSNGLINIDAIDGEQNNSGGNLLTNSSWDDWTGNTPDNWEITVGTAGTQVTKESSIVYDGDFSLAITGSGGVNTALRQLFDDSTGTLGTLDPLTQYSCNLFLRRDGTAAAAGVLTVELVDSGGTVIQDENGVNNSFTIDLTALTTSFVAYNGAFRTPTDLPDEMYLRLRCSTALTNGRVIYADRISLGVMQQLYVGGPFLAVHSGSIPFQLNDFSTCAITNSRGAAGTLSTFQTLFYRLFPEMISNELLLPSSGTPTIDDALIA